jgi:hypothetical protein
MSDYLKIVLRRALTNGDPGLVQLSFDAAVIDRYRQQGYQVIRTDSAGRIRKQGGWSLDVGIADDDATVHCSWAALTTALPESERDHWAMHAVPSAALSENYLRMQMSPGSCFDDGELRSWE